MKNIEKYINKRNTIWESNSAIPKWVDVKNVDLDQFFTKIDTANKCYQKLIDYLKSKNVSVDDCLFVEPSAGAGAFFNLLPEKQRIGLDICPMSEGIIEQEFFSWQPPLTDKKIVVLGNPPFGYRSWLALLFMQKASEFADYVAFILPMAFQSEGKGCPKNRVKNLKVASSEILSPNSFETPDGKDYKINALFQIWEKGENQIINNNVFQDYFDIFTVDNRKERLCGQEKMKQADFFLQRTFFNQPPNLVKSFSNVKYVCGYGFIVKKDKEKLINFLDNVDWVKYSNLAAHGCRHISMCHIWRALLDYGFNTTGGL